MFKKMKPAAIVVFFALLVTCSEGASFSGLGDLPGSAFASFAYDVSNDGSVVVGYSFSASGAEAFRWTPSTGMAGLGYLPGATANGSVASGVSGDGLMIVGSSQASTGLQAFRWTANTGMTGLDDLAGGDTTSAAYGISSDGTTIVGFGVSELGDRAVRWVSGGPPSVLNNLDTNHAQAVSGDGLTIVGTEQTSGTQAFRWTLSTGMVGLGNLPGGGFAVNAQAISADGNVIVGQSSTNQAVRWTQATGLVSLGDLPGGTSYSYALDTSGDGSVVVGTGQTALGEEAFVWDDAHGMRNLRDVLISDYGMTDLSGWVLTRARGISADGTTIVGEGMNPSGQSEAWRVTGVPEPSSALSFFASVLAMLHYRPLRSRRRERP